MFIFFLLCFNTYLNYDDFLYVYINCYLNFSHRHAPALLITQSCLRILLSFTAGNKSIEEAEHHRTMQDIDFKDWCLNTEYFDSWMEKKNSYSTQNNTFLQEKYFYIWKNGV